MIDHVLLVTSLKLHAYDLTQLATLSRSNAHKRSALSAKNLFFMFAFNPASLVDFLFARIGRCGEELKFCNVLKYAIVQGEERAKRAAAEQIVHKGTRCI